MDAPKPYKFIGFGANHGHGARTPKSGYAPRGHIKRRAEAKTCGPPSPATPALPPGQQLGGPLAATQTIESFFLKPNVGGRNQGLQKHTNIEEYVQEAGFGVLPAVVGRRATFHD